MYYKGTKKECENYNKLVTASFNFQGVTNSWSKVQEINGCFYIDKHDNYDSEMELVNELPQIEEDV